MNRSVKAGDHHAVWREFGEQPVALFALPQRFFGALSFRDVQQGARRADGLALFTLTGEESPALRQHPELAAFRQSDPAFVFELAQAARIERSPQLQPSEVAIGRVDKGGELFESDVRLVRQAEN